MNPPLRYAPLMDTQQAPENESLRLELQEAIVTYRHWVSQLTQMTGFFIAGTVILVSYGFTQKIAAILLFAAPAPILILLTYVVVASVASPVLELILRLERRLQIRENSLGTTYVQSHLGSMAADIGNIEDYTDEEVRRLRLHPSRRRLFWAPVPIILYVSTLFLLGLFVLSITVFHYRFM